jgi:hypothetical protein
MRFNRTMAVHCLCRRKNFKNKAMLKRLNDISSLPDIDRQEILYTIDGLV